MVLIERPAIAYPIYPEMVLGKNE